MVGISCENIASDIDIFLKVNSEKRNQSFKLDLSNQFRQQNDHGYLGWDYYKFSLAVLKILKLKMS